MKICYYNYFNIFIILAIFCIFNVYFYLIYTFLKLSIINEKSYYLKNFLIINLKFLIAINNCINYNK